jgi:hypothetical protein
MVILPGLGLSARSTSKIYHIPLTTFVEFGGSPLTVQLVDVGVPVVVGMADEVFDQASRLFTRHLRGALGRRGIHPALGRAYLFLAISARSSGPTPFPITMGKIGNNILGGRLSWGKVISWIANEKNKTLDEPAFWGWQFGRQISWVRPQAFHLKETTSS